MDNNRKTTGWVLLEPTVKRWCHPASKLWQCSWASHCIEPPTTYIYPVGYLPKLSMFSFLEDLAETTKSRHQPLLESIQRNMPGYVIPHGGHAFGFIDFIITLSIFLGTGAGVVLFARYLMRRDHAVTSSAPSTALRGQHRSESEVSLKRELCRFFSF